MKYDVRRPVLKRVLSVEVNGRPLQPNATYRLVTSQFMFRHAAVSVLVVIVRGAFSGGDGCSGFREARPVVDACAGSPIADALIAFLRARPHFAFAPVVEGRVLAVDADSSLPSLSDLAANSQARNALLHAGPVVLSFPLRTPSPLTPASPSPPPASTSS